MGDAEAATEILIFSFRVLFGGQVKETFSFARFCGFGVSKVALMNDQKSHSRAEIWDLSRAINRYAPAKVAPKKIARDKQTLRLFESIQARILALVASYKCIIDATERYPGITRQITICIDKLGALTRAEFCQWRSKPKRAFQNMSPQEFFRSKDLKNLEHALGLLTEPPQSPKNTDV